MARSYTPLWRAPLISTSPTTNSFDLDPTLTPHRRSSLPSSVRSPPPPQPRPFEIHYDPCAGPRKAPRPPQYRHRRKRSRHMRFKDPAHSGLFTLTEVMEEEEVRPVAYATPSISRTPSAVPSSTCFPCPSPRVELSTTSDVLAVGEMEEIVLEETSTEEEVPCSPPFVFDELIPETLARPSRRPPPLDLSKKPLSRYRSHPFASSHPPSEPRPLSDSSLLSPLPILSPGVFRARQRSASTPSPQEETAFKMARPLEDIRPPHSRHETSSATSSRGSDVDLESVLQELLASCGEISPRFSQDYSEDWTVFVEKGNERPLSCQSLTSEASCDMASFPLPPARQLGSPIALSPLLVTPVTPPETTCNPFDSPVTRTSERGTSWRPKLSSTHSFLQAMSRNEEMLPASPTPSGSTSSSGSSGSRLPKRKGLPEMWLA
ncbi:hypothetical protein BD324DRAFT_653660 [Kockovaella imperatae]|uniref:Uncharacterized protein n=1 Tax=Kockovaella imperatae TaxID=4999 RepID=A0A1Y1U7H3_9TREE|nr:hypothetical protein BD324DRAFT_653660 [Kockovaella imperatae]ORX33962.1 hypothetical protein BD324DRAFT_653660 [Kockovaella imperatae]